MIWICSIHYGHWAKICKACIAGFLENSTSFVAPFFYKSSHFLDYTGFNTQGIYMLRTQACLLRKGKNLYHKFFMIALQS